MDTTTAIATINRMTYKKGWTFRADDKTDRFEGGICVHITYPVCLSEDPNRCDIEVVPSFNLQVREDDTTETLCRKVLDLVARIDSHEAREFLKLDGSAPFHPHTIEGMIRWGDPDADLGFGVS